MDGMQMIRRADTDPIEATVVRPEIDSGLEHEIGRWSDPQPRSAVDGLGLAWLVTARIRRVGRHHLDAALLAGLADVRRRHHGRDAYLDAFLDSVLARHHDDFGHRGYLSLPLLELILADPDSGLDEARLAALLMADVVRHEGLSRSDERPDELTRGRRIRHAARFVAHREPALGSTLPTAPGTLAGDWLRLTVLPVSVAHDEYFVIRALQAHALFGPAEVLVRVVSTLRAADFAVFGPLTRGAELELAMDRLGADRRGDARAARPGDAAA